MEDNFYIIWKNLEQRYYTEGDVVCLIPLVGYFGWHGDEIVKVQPKKYSSGGVSHQISISTYEPCTNGDLAELQSAIDMGIGQLILHPYHRFETETKVLMYGTGRTGTSPVYRRANKSLQATAGTPRQIDMFQSDDLSDKAAGSPSRA